MGCDQREVHTSVRVIVADNEPERGAHVAAVLGAHLTEEVACSTTVPGGQPLVLLVLGADDADEALAALLGASEPWFGEDRAVLVHGPGVGRWSLRAKARLLLAARCTLLDDLEPEFAPRLVAAAGSILAQLAGQHAEEARARDALAVAGLVGESPALLEVGRQLLRASALRGAAVLVSGETGTGKELVARAIHRLDRERSGGPFVPVNCAALTPSLAESEMFGHRRGAYTGADAARTGFLRSGSRGVVFLDEVGDLPPGLQAKLLRALQEQRVQPVGEDREVAIDVRVVSATNRNLDAMIEAGEFRRDLLHRIAAFTIHLPPLRERREDLPLLVRHIARRYAASPPAIEADVLAALSAATWRGNVRELEHTIAQALAFHPGDRTLELRDLPPVLLRALSIEGGGTDSAAPEPGEDLGALAANVCMGRRNLEETLTHCEREIVSRVLRHARNNQSRAARLLGVTPRSMYDKVRRLRIRE